ncbi:hypothetical protein HD806DRAFT_472291 [Xylariaceae sp. AK1471]|nr:hypothetical protein HD806DRAFT_472291 [Xylariaceae sp. AK1471]
MGRATLYHLSKKRRLSDNLLQCVDDDDVPLGPHRQLIRKALEEAEVYRLECKEEKARFEVLKNKHIKLQDDILAPKAQVRTYQNIAKRLRKDLDKKEKDIQELRLSR